MTTSRLNRYFLGALVVSVVSGCAKDVEVSYPSPSGSVETGVVLVRFTEPMQSVAVVVEGVLVAEDEHTERVQVTNVPIGSHEVTVVAATSGRTASVARTEVVTVDSAKPAVLLIATPPRSLGSWIYDSVAVLVYGLLIFATYDR